MLVLSTFRRLTVVCVCTLLVCQCRSSTVAAAYERAGTFKDLHLGDAHLIPLPDATEAGRATDSDASSCSHLQHRDGRQYVCLMVVYKAFWSGERRTHRIDQKVGSFADSTEWCANWGCVSC